MSSFHPSRLASVIALAVASTATGYAASPWLIFTAADGSQRSIATEGLELTFEGSTVTAVNTAGATLTLDAAELQSMQFSDQMSSVSEIHAETVGAVTLFDLQGHALGRYPSACEARRALAPGVYILRDESGLTVKLSVR